MTRRTFLVPLFAAAIILAPSTLSGQVIPIAGPFEASPRSYGFTDPGTYEPRIPAAAALADGSFVVSWEERIEISPPGEPSFTFYDLYARKIRSGGSPGRLVRVDRGSAAGPETVEPRAPELAADGQGGFVLAWERERFRGFDVLYQRSPAGRFVRENGGRLLHPAQEGQVDRSPAVAANAAGDWVLAWEEWRDEGGLDRALGIRAFRASGQPAGAEIRIESPDPAVALVRPRVAIQQDGSFFVIWGAFADSRISRLQGRAFEADGTPRGPVFQIGQGMNSWDVVTGGVASGELLVAWQTGSGTQSVLRLRRYSAEGDRLTTKVLNRGLRNWRLASNHEGDVVFLWTDSQGIVQARLLNQNGVPKGPPFNVASVSDEPWIGDIAISDAGKIFAVWIDPREFTTDSGDTHQLLLGRLWEVREGASQELSRFRTLLNTQRKNRPNKKSPAP
jgi:hypothetical protein